MARRGKTQLLASPRSNCARCVLLLTTIWRRVPESAQRSSERRKWSDSRCLAVVVVHQLSLVPSLPAVLLSTDLGAPARRRQRSVERAMDRVLLWRGLGRAEGRREGQDGRAREGRKGGGGRWKADGVQWCVLQLLGMLDRPADTGMRCHPLLNPLPSTPLCPPPS